MSDTDMLYIASLEKRIEMLEHENVELKRIFINLVCDVSTLNKKTVSIIDQYGALVGKDKDYR